jgi:hypothetical protein
MMLVKLPNTSDKSVCYKVCITTTVCVIAILGALITAVYIKLGSNKGYVKLPYPTAIENNFWRCPKEVLLPLDFDDGDRFAMVCAQNGTKFANLALCSKQLNSCNEKTMLDVNTLRHFRYEFTRCMKETCKRTTDGYCRQLINNPTPITVCFNKTNSLDHVIIANESQYALNAVGTNKLIDYIAYFFDTDYEPTVIH